MRRYRRPVPGPESVWRVLRRITREAARHEEWRRRFDREQRARETAWRRRMEAEAKARNEEAEARRRELVAELEARRQEAEARSRKLEAEADARRKQLEADAEARRRRLDEQRAEFERVAARQEQERQVREAKADREFKRAIHRMIGDGDERFGRLMEALTEGDLAPLLQDAGFPVREPPLRRMGVSHGRGFATEFDLIAMGDAVTVVVEVKATLRPEYVKDFVDKMERFRGWFPDHSRGALHGAMAYLSATDTAPKMAGRRGLLLIRVVGSSASIVNEPGFTPRSF